MGLLLDKYSNDLDDFIQITMFLNLFATHCNEMLEVVIDFLQRQGFEEKVNIYCGGHHFELPRKVNQNELEEQGLGGYLDFLQREYCSTRICPLFVHDLDFEFQSPFFYSRTEIMKLDFITDLGFNVYDREYLATIYYQFIDLQREYDKMYLVTQEDNCLQKNEVTKQLTGIYKYNHDKAQTKKMAGIIAQLLWEADTEQQIKMGDMVQQLKPLLYQFNDKATPDTDDTIKGWIKEFAPDYARKAGRTPNNQPKEITLTLKR